MDSLDVKSKLNFIEKDIIDGCLSGMNLKLYKKHQWEKGPLSQWDTGSEERYYNYEGNLPSNSHEEEYLWNNGIGVLSVSNNTRDMGYGMIFKDETISYLSKNGNFNLFTSVTNEDTVKYIFKASFSTPIGNFVITDDTVKYYDEDLINSYVEIRANERLKTDSVQSNEIKNILLNEAKTHYNSGAIDELDSQIMTNPTREFNVNLNEAISFANALANNNMEKINSLLDSKRI